LPLKDPEPCYDRFGWRLLTAIRFSKSQFKRLIVFQQTFVLIDNQAIAATRCLLEASTIDNLDFASRVVDEPCLLQHPRRNRYGRPVNSEHLAEKFVR
jgi:hypothetical protein